MTNRFSPKPYGLALLVALASACGAESEPSSEAAPIEAPPDLIGALDESLDVEWTPVDQMKIFGLSKTVVVAHVVGTEPAVHRSTPWDESAQRYLTVEEAGEDVSELPLTVVHLEVTEVIRGGLARGGSAAQVGSEIQVVFLGGSGIQVAGQPIPAVGEEAVFFLSSPLRAAGVSDFRGTYSLTAGGQTMIAIRDHLVDQAEGPFAGLNGKTRDSFLELVRSRAQTIPWTTARPEIDPAAFL